MPSAIPEYRPIHESNTFDEVYASPLNHSDETTVTNNCPCHEYTDEEPYTQAMLGP